MAPRPEQSPSNPPSLFPRLQLAKRTSADGKTRVFSVQLAAYLAADALWQHPQSITGVKPVWIVLLGSPAQSTAFVANFRTGTKAGVGSTAFQLPKRSGHRWHTQTIAFGERSATMTIGYLPDLFHLDPSRPLSIDRPVEFVFAPPRWWVDKQATALAGDFGDDAGDAAEAALFAAFLDRRTTLPIVHDLRFHLQLYRAALDTSWIATPREGVRTYGTAPFGQRLDQVGLATVLACSARHTTIVDFLQKQTAIYHAEEIRRGQTRVDPTRRLLPDAGAVTRQLRLDFAMA